MTIAVNFSFYPGEDVSLPITIYEADDATLQNITGWSLSFIIHQQGGPALVTKTVGNGIVLTTPASGLLTVTLASADTLLLEPGNYQFSLMRTGTGVVSELTVGSLILLGA